MNQYFKYDPGFFSKKKIREWKTTFAAFGMKMK